MEFFKRSTHIDFMGLRRYSAILSLLLFVISIGGLLTRGLNFGLDFTGGVQVQIQYTAPIALTQIRSQLNAQGFGDAVVQNYGTSHDLLISIPPQKGVGVQTLAQELIHALPGAELERVEAIGPEVGQELTTKGALAIVIALLGTMIYIALRFEWRFAVSAALALVHDPILILGVFAFTQMEFNLTALAAVLAVIGYSLNDTIVIFDRVRENFRKSRKGSPVEIMNLSINQTLSRTIMTSAMTLVVVLALFFLGGAMIHGFAAALMVGIIIGTYSSIYVAGALAITMGLNRSDLLPKTVKASLSQP